MGTPGPWWRPPCSGPRPRFRPRSGTWPASGASIRRRRASTRAPSRRGTRSPSARGRPRRSASSAGCPGARADTRMRPARTPPRAAGPRDRAAARAPGTRGWRGRRGTRIATRQRRLRRLRRLRPPARAAPRRPTRPSAASPLVSWSSAPVSGGSSLGSESNTRPVSAEARARATPTAITTSQPITTTIMAETSSIPHEDRSVALSTGSRTMAWPPTPGFMTLVSTKDQSAV